MAAVGVRHEKHHSYRQPNSGRHEWVSVTQAMRRRLWGLHTDNRGAQDDPEEAFIAWQEIINNKDRQSQKLTPDAPLVEFYYGEAALTDLD